METVAILSLAIMTIINGYWTWQSKQIQNDRDVIRAIQLQLKLKEEAIQQMVTNKNQLKRQYEHQLAENHKLVGQLNAYKKFHKHA